MEALAKRIAVSLVRGSDAAEGMVDKCAYGLVCLLILGLNVCAILILGILTHSLIPTVAAALSGAMLRTFSGGPHLSSPWRCAVFSSILAVTLGWMGSMLPTNFAAICVITTITALLVLRYAPVDSSAKPIPAARKPFFRNASLLTVVVLALLCILLTKASLVMTGPALVGMLWQGLSLTPAGVWTYKATDHGMRRLTILLTEVKK